MSDTKTASWIAALERARAELESVLSVDAHLRAPRGSAGDADWAGYEKALATNPVHRCWAQLSDAIEELRRRPQAEAGRRRVSLRDVLEHIRSDDASERPAAAPADASPTPPEPAAPEAEEATVSFVIREPGRAVPVAGNGSGASAGKAPPPPATPETAPDPGAEAEVVIVPRRR